MTSLDRIRHIRFWLALFIIGLVMSGVTAFPIQKELGWLLIVLRGNPIRSIAESTPLPAWIERVSGAVTDTNARYPFLAYGTDWLGFAHLVIAVVFIGPYIDPVRNKWVINFGFIACAGVLPLALIAGPIRGIPLSWRLIDCSFGILGTIPLLLCRRSILILERQLSEEDRRSLHSATLRSG